MTVKHASERLQHWTDQLAQVRAMTVYNATWRQQVETRINDRIRFWQAELARLEPNEVAL